MVPSFCRFDYHGTDSSIISSTTSKDVSGHNPTKRGNTSLGLKS